MRPSPEVHDALACLFTYPGDGAGEKYPAAIAEVQRSAPETAECLERFSAGIAGIDPGKLEELYTHTFDNVSERSLEIGWQLFGEQYARGALLVRLRDLMRKYGVQERTELPDHLSHVLALIGRAPTELATSLATNQVAQAVAKAIEGFESIESPWVSVLEATEVVLRMHAPDESASEASTKETSNR